MIYDTASSLYKSFLKRPLWQSLALNILQREHGDAFKHLPWFACILKSKVAVGCLEAILSRLARQRSIGLLTGLPFTAKEIAAVGKVFLSHFLKLRTVYRVLAKRKGCKQGDVARNFRADVAGDYLVWNYYFTLLKEASGVDKDTVWSITSKGFMSTQDKRLQSSLTAGAPGTFAMRTTEDLQNTWTSSLYGLSPALLEKPISGKVCWLCSKKTETKMQKCSRCNIAHYCSRQCQRNDWQGHSTECGRLQLWSSHIIKTCRKPGNSDASTIEEALAQKMKSQRRDHARTYKRTDFLLQKRDFQMFSGLDCKVFGVATGNNGKYQW